MIHFHLLTVCKTTPKEKEWNLERVKLSGILFFQVLVSIKLSALFFDISNSFYRGIFFVRKGWRGVKSCMYRRTLFSHIKINTYIYIYIYVNFCKEKKKKWSWSSFTKSNRHQVRDQIRQHEGAMKRYAWNCELKKNWRECLLWANLRWDTRPFKKRVHFLKVVQIKAAK